MRRVSASVYSMAIARRLQSLFSSDRHGEVVAAIPPSDTGYPDQKGVVLDASSGDGGPGADRTVAPGELSFEEDIRGGMGRHLGLTSTTFLM